MKSQYLYFPKCKIHKADLIQATQPKILLYIKSTAFTPKFYPPHEIIQGKIECLFPFQTNILYGENKNNFIQIFNDDVFDNQKINLVPKKLLKKELSLLVFFSPEESLILQPVALGLKNEMPIFFINGIAHENEKLSHMVFLEHELSHKNSKESKKVKL